jgi:hypothetical protein
MRGEGFRDNFFVSQHLTGLIGIVLAAFIAPDYQASGEGRPRREGVCLTQRDSMPIKVIFLMVESMVFADDHPAVPACIPHAYLHEDFTAVGRWSSTVRILTQLNRGSKELPVGITSVWRPSRERHSPEWRPANRQSGDWRTRISSPSSHTNSGIQDETLCDAVSDGPSRPGGLELESYPGHLVTISHAANL